ncbi:O-acetylhomoserine aminocarboxypropyltransferase/cysteine synthase family protein [Natranaeroarchaeum sulfidigenes]|uniref:O-acetylhomoserine sulfhydrylase n=1 Tax=Natranaeroarchaeum sulfidigenes TaxID=2784880 RepID=A0A897MQR0_9EURY|nr:O-acetylhomoserine aminocarboxypropyltransferase/cysteine synthase family protein [Natranaeroarchaeum sulfidigenes]QSG01333.1 O-acetylhomoserine sulfhydrylase [Natranaeroarchaeum sulfidigenes]
MTDRDLSKFRTRSLHAGQSPDPATRSRAPPLYQTTSYVFDDADHAAELYALDREEDIYSRMSNPTVSMLEERLASLEGGSRAVATGSGMAALDAATLVLAEVGDNVVCSTDTYGGTSAYLSHTAKRRGIEVRFVPTLDIDAYEEAIDEDTAYVHVETIGNPSLVTPDFEAVADVAHTQNVPLVVDNTFGTPALCRPFEHGADVVWESTTKWIHGSGTTVGGVLVEDGEFDWAAGGYEEIAGQNAAYHDTDFTRDFPEAPFSAAVRYRSLRSLGNQQKPFDAWETLQGVETLPIRMEKHCENAAIVAEYLAEHDEVAWVSYPGLASHETHENATRYLDGGYGGMVAFGLEDGYTAGKRFCEATELASFLANIGDAKTLVIHPASTTHGQLTPEEQEEAGVTPDLVRLSVGIEDPADILADIEAAIEEATAT